MQRTHGNSLPLLDMLELATVIMGRGKMNEEGQKTEEFFSFAAFKHCCKSQHHKLRYNVIQK